MYIGVAAIAGLDSVSERGQLVVLLLRPGVERMVVALGADQLRAQKDLGRVGHVVQGHARVTQVVPGPPPLSQV